MTRREWGITVTALLTMAAGSALLVRWEAWQRLGRPGVKLVAEPSLALEREPGSTNRFIRVGTNRVELPAVVGGYSSTPVPLDPSVWKTLPADTTYGQRLYKRTDGFWIRNDVVLMGADRTSIHQPQYCLTGQGWEIVQSERASIRLQGSDAYDLPVMKLTMRRQQRDEAGRETVLSMVFLYWFVADGYVTEEHRERMWLQARELILRGVLQRWAYVICYAPCVPGQEAATFERLRQFVAESVPLYHVSLSGGTRSG